TPPSIGGKGVRSEVTSKALNLSAWITNDGISLKTSSGNIAPGCEGLGAGLTVPKKGEDYNLATLTDCARKLKSAKPDFKDETQVTITASPGIEYKTVIDVMDALRSDGTEELFPEVHFGVAR
ncbi:MAG TPA: biopolymer transporter ExbD, partial [Minicystis sp.]|nr:biopolymer transporter ExbD [Minicystis sp.]